jgi:hypothetical protein
MGKLGKEHIFGLKMGPSCRLKAGLVQVIFTMLFAYLDIPDVSQDTLGDFAR